MRGRIRVSEGQSCCLSELCAQAICLGQILSGHPRNLFPSCRIPRCWPAGMCIHYCSLWTIALNGMWISLASFHFGMRDEEAVKRVCSLNTLQESILPFQTVVMHMKELIMSSLQDLLLLPAVLQIYIRDLSPRLENSGSTWPPVMPRSLKLWILGRTPGVISTPGISDMSWNWQS